MPDDAIERARQARNVLLSILGPNAHSARKSIRTGAGTGAVSVNQAIAAMLAFASQQAPGMVLVPREPTHDMLHGAMTASRLSDPSPLPSCKELWAAGQVWSAMLDAAPSVTLGEAG